MDGARERAQESTLEMGALEMPREAIVCERGTYSAHKNWQLKDTGYRYSTMSF